MTAKPKTTPDEPTASIEEIGDWKLVTFGTWQISVDPAGLLMLPRHLHPRERADFVAAGSMACRVGDKVIAENAEKAAKDDRTLPKARAIVAEGGRAAGATPMLVTPGPNTPRRPQRSAATIGRGKRAGTAY